MNFHFMCFWLPVTRKGTFALLSFWFTKVLLLGFDGSWPVFHTHASYAGVVCCMKDRPRGEVLGLCSTGQ